MYHFFTHRGKLYAGGGYETFVKGKPEQPEYTHSYLLCLEGKTWKTIEQEYGGIVFGVYKRNGKSYLATVINTSFGSKRANILTKRKMNK